MSGNLNKQYIKNYVIRFANGKVDKVEQLIEEQIEEVVPRVELSWSKEQKAYKDEIINFAKAGVNFAFAVFNEKVVYKVVQLEKQKNLTPEQKLVKILTVIFPEVQKITSQSPKVANYHNVEVNTVAKYKKLKDLTEEEIIVLKKKIKAPIINFAKKQLAEQQMPGVFKEFLGAEQITKTLLDIFDVIADEKLIKKFIDYAAKAREKYDENPQIYKFLPPFKAIKEMGLVEEVKELIRVFTNHLNKLADKVSQYQDIPSTESERMLEKLSGDIKNEVGQNTPPPIPADQNFDGVLSSIGEIFKAIGDSNKSELFADVDGALSNEQMGDKVEVATKNFRQSEKEKNDSVLKPRLAHFKGTVIAQRNQNQISYTFSVLKDSKGRDKLAIRSTFSYHSPFIVSVKKTGKIMRKVCRAKLNYLEKELAEKKDNE
ncbi:13863_t:CDS:2 [Funneliformis geosporum]|nr:13863_t:CDS:2 [Funneliformis geosporum]